MPREELVTSLMDPRNADICRSQLGIHIEGKPELQTLAARAREAVAEVIETWATRPRLKGRPLIDLDAEKIEEGRESRERLSIEDLLASLSHPLFRANLDETHDSNLRSMGFSPHSLNFES